ncbi:hypothetical protein B5S32_g4601 [[Candida] boidinii]|nr:hypothetical protein B5S32_g4601 [[Candida] boidinii]
MANDLIEKESISVVVRCRGRNTRETDSKSPIIVDVPSITGSDQVSINTSGDFSLASKISSTRTYKVDQVYGPGADQQTFFDGVASPLFEEFLKGYNCTVFAYGQTGTGKTYTMCGDLGGNDFIRSTVTSQENSSVELKDPIGNNKTISDIKNLINNNSNKNIENKINNFEISTDAGLVPRILCKLFENLNILRDDWSVKCSFVEIYNEELKDLLADPTTSRSSKLRIFEKKKPNSITNSIKIDGLEEMYISNVDQGLSLLKQGIECRKTASTKLNDYSSRSHTIFTITLLKKNINNEYQISKLNLVDLAGSENILRSGAVNQRAKEAGSINQSLLTLGRVINSLVDGGNYIPYRECKLTRILQDSLGGDTKTILVANISPSILDCQATLSTLEYATKAKNIKNNAVIGSSVLKTVLVKELTDEISRLKMDLLATRSKEGIILSESNYKDLMIDQENYKSEIEEMKRNNEILNLKLSQVNETLNNSQRDNSEIRQQIEIINSKNNELKTEIDSKNLKEIELINISKNAIELANKEHENLINFQNKNKEFLNNSLNNEILIMKKNFQKLIEDNLNDNDTINNSINESINFESNEFLSENFNSDDIINNKLIKGLNQIINKISIDFENLKEENSIINDSSIFEKTEEFKKFKDELNNKFKEINDSIKFSNFKIESLYNNIGNYGNFLENNFLKINKNLIEKNFKLNSNKLDGLINNFKIEVNDMIKDSINNTINDQINDFKTIIGTKQKEFDTNSYNDVMSIKDSLNKILNSIEDNSIKIINKSETDLGNLNYIKAKLNKENQILNNLQPKLITINEFSNIIFNCFNSINEFKDKRVKSLNSIEIIINDLQSKISNHVLEFTNTDNNDIRGSSSAGSSVSSGSENYINKFNQLNMILDQFKISKTAVNKNRSRPSTPVVSERLLLQSPERKRLIGTPDRTKRPLTQNNNLVNVEEMENKRKRVESLNNNGNYKNNQNSNMSLNNNNNSSIVSSNKSRISTKISSRSSSFQNSRK